MGCEIDKIIIQNIDSDHHWTLNTDVGCKIFWSLKIRFIYNKAAYIE